MQKVAKQINLLNAVFQSFTLFVFGIILSFSQTNHFNVTEIIGIENFFQGIQNPIYYLNLIVQFAKIGTSGQHSSRPAVDWQQR